MENNQYLQNVRKTEKELGKERKEFEEKVKQIKKFLDKTEIKSKYKGLIKGIPVEKGEKGTEPIIGYSAYFKGIPSKLGLEGKRILLPIMENGKEIPLEELSARYIHEGFHGIYFTEAMGLISYSNSYKVKRRMVLKTLTIDLGSLLSSKS